MLSNGLVIKVTMRASPDNDPDHPDVRLMASEQSCYKERLLPSPLCHKHLLHLDSSLQLPSWFGPELAQIP